MSQPLTDSINALTTYANTVTGASDQTLSEAVATLASGYGGGGIDLSSVSETNAHNNITGLFNSMMAGKWATLDLHVSSGTNPINIAFGRTIKGFICYPIGITVLSDLEVNERVAFNMSIFTDNGDNTQTLLWNVNKMKNSGQNANDVFNRISSYTFSNGTLSLVPSYPSNANYNPFGFNYTYKFIYWWE